MEITYLGQSCVRLRGRETQVLVDPPDGDLPGMTRLAPDLTVRTTGRTDPDRLRPSADRTQEIAGAGEFEVRGVAVQAIATAAGRTIVRIEIDDVRVACLGTLDRQLSEDEIESLGHVDVLVLPVGGGAALPAQQATKVVNAVEPSIVIPVHYRHPSSPGSGELDPVDTFAKEMGLAEGSYQAQAKLTISGSSSGGDAARVVILEPRGS